MTFVVIRFRVGAKETSDKAVISSFSTIRTSLSHANGKELAQPTNPASRALMCEFQIFTVRAFASRAIRISKRVANGTNNTLTSFSANATGRSPLGRSVYLQCPGCGNLDKPRSSSWRCGWTLFGTIGAGAVAEAV
jgi:hypothetical protein